MATMATAQMPHNFHEFFMKWTAEQKLHLHELISATKPSISSTTTTATTTTTTSRDSLVNQVIGHYEEYYRVKSDWAQEYVLLMLSPPWRTKLESSFQWIGGWRPTMAFHLLYSKSGLQLEAWLDHRGGTTPPPDDLGELSSHQLTLVNQLQLTTVEEERKISEMMAERQETIADKEIVELSHEVTMSMGDETGIQADHDHDHDYDQIESTLKPKEDGLKKILESADGLRLRTLKGVIQILTPSQALHFLIAAAELHLRLHDWGKQHNDQQTQLAL